MNEFAIFAVLGICALIGAMLGDMKKRFWEGAALGAILGPIGCIIAILLPEPTK